MAAGGLRYGRLSARERCSPSLYGKERDTGMRCTVQESEGVRKSKVHTLLYTKQFSTGIYQSLTASPCNQDGREKTATEVGPEHFCLSGTITNCVNIARLCAEKDPPWYVSKRNEVVDRWQVNDGVANE